MKTYYRVESESGNYNEKFNDKEKAYEAAKQESHINKNIGYIIFEKKSYPFSDQEIPIDTYMNGKLQITERGDQLTKK